MHNNRAAAVIVAALILAGASPLIARAANAPAPASLVDPFVGTSGTKIGGPIDTFPGADVPFGMVQWSPDTPSQNAGGGYEYGDHEITGFSLTHLSGPGCSVFGDFAILPALGAVTDPAIAKQPFSHANETATPGSYSVALGDPPIRTDLAVTARTGLGRFTFPANAQADLLFDVASNQAGVTAAHVRVDSSTQISGDASSGFFCGMADQYTVYFVARFDRPFVAYGTWQNARVSANAGAAGGPRSGAYVTFDATRNPQVRVKIGLSFVSVDGAVKNLEAENRDWDIDAMRARAAAAWNVVLSRIAATGGTPAQQRTFYTALYHALLHPNVVSDVDGRYTGFDSLVHRVERGRSEYANYSDWDIYRTEVPLLALIAPDETGDMMQSLVDAFKQEGWLPRWPLVNGPTSVMGGDSIDPVIAGAYAFGARNFDVRTALTAMVKGASTTAGKPAQRWYVPRWELDDDYLRRGYVVNTHTTSVAPVPNGASETLEYALDDFSIARFARAIGKRRIARTFAPRGENWATLFDRSSGWIAPRDAAGAFMHPEIGENGQSGFQEGNAAQYTWMVPQDLRDLIAGMGGNAAATAKLDAFFAQIDAGQDKPYAWLGNEPSLGAPWVYLSAGAPWRTQSIVRQALTTLYADAPDGIPGNDDLGTMSAWYVWSAIGLYPANPAVRGFDVGSPLFASVVVHSPNGPSIDVEAPNASTATPYVQALRVNGAPSQKTWVALPAHGSLRLDFDLGANPNRAWGSAPGDAPPSYAPNAVAFAPASAARLATAATSVSLAAGGSVAGEFSIDNTSGSASATVAWQARLPAGLHATAATGTIAVAAGKIAAVTLQLSSDAGLRAGYYDVPIVAVAGGNVPLAAATAIVRVSAGAASPNAARDPIAYAENRFGNTITPIDLVTGAVGPEIASGGEEPRDAVLSADDSRLYVTNRGSSSVSVIDTARERVVATVKVGQSPNGIHLSPDGRTIWLANSDDGTIQSIDASTLQAAPPIRVGANPRDLAIAPDGATLYVSDGGDNAVTPVDVATRTPRPQIAAGRRPSGIAITPDGKRLYVVGTASNDVTPIDVATRTARPPIPVGISPMLIAISPNGGLAYVSNYANSTITPIDLATDTARAGIDVGGAPYGVAFTRDGKRAIVVVRRDNACVILDPASGRRNSPIALGNGPYTVAAP
jgi:predicted alpha-1,2-mannosidase